MYIEEEHFRRKNNNFDALRLLAALLVFASHATGFCNPLQKEPLAALTNDEFHMSHIGLYIFFTLSGFLVTRSLQRSSAIDYWRNRLLRIVPGIAVWAFIMATITGPAFTTQSLREYWTDPYILYFVLQNAIPIHIAFTLPGVFEGKAINPSLWTIPLEIKCYLLLFLAPFIRFLKLKHLVLASWLVLLAIYPLINSIDHAWIKTLHPYRESLKLVACFFGGASFYLYRSNLPLKISIWLALLVTWLAAWKISTALLPVPTLLFFIYTIICVGASKKVMPFFQADISYGIYLYGASIQKAIFFSIGSQLAFWQFNAITLALTIVLALASWHFIEKQALKLKRHRPVVPVGQAVTQPVSDTDHHKK